MLQETSQMLMVDDVAQEPLSAHTAIPALPYLNKITSPKKNKGKKSRRKTTVAKMKQQKKDNILDLE